MARILPTRVEELDLQKPGLRQLVDLNLDAFRTLESIQQRVLEKFGVKIPQSTLSSYKQRRWLQQKRRVQSIKEHAAAILQVLDKHGVGEVRQALLFERVQQALDAGADLDPHFMLREERQWETLKLKREQLEQDKKALEVKIENMRQERERERKQITEAVGGSKDPELAMARIREIYGLA